MSRSVKNSVVISTAAVAFALSAAATANAATVAALQDGKTISIIDTDKKAVTRSVAIDGGATLVGMDVRPSDGRLYGVTPAGVIVTIDPMTGKWDKKSQISEKMPADAMYTVDFNPVADRLRVISSSGMSLRINVEDGKATVDGALKYADADKMKGMAPKVVAGAYTNSIAGTKDTALFDIDMAHGTLVKQAPPNDGVLNTVGALGVKVDGAAAFDIVADGAGGNVAMLLTGGTLHTVDLTTGAATAIGKVAGLTGRTIDMAVLPKK